MRRYVHVYLVLDVSRKPSGLNFSFNLKRRALRSLEMSDQTPSDVLSRPERSVTSPPILRRNENLKKNVYSGIGWKLTKLNNFLALWSVECPVQQQGKSEEEADPFIFCASRVSSLREEARQWNRGHRLINPWTMAGSKREQLTVWRLTTTIGVVPHL